MTVSGLLGLAFFCWIAWKAVGSNSLWSVFVIGIFAILNLAYGLSGKVIPLLLGLGCLWQTVTHYRAWQASRASGREKSGEGGAKPPSF